MINIICIILSSVAIVIGLWIKEFCYEDDIPAVIAYFICCAVVIVCTIIMVFPAIKIIDEAYKAHKEGSFSSCSIQCTAYDTRVVTKKRIFSFTDTYDTYEKTYCVNYVRVCD